MLAAALVTGGCGDEGLSPAEAVQLAEPHLEHFASFDRWARRALAADPAFRSRDSLEETVFAPVRREEPVTAVWIERESPDRRLVFGHLDAPPKDLRWVEVRHDALGALDVSTAKVPDPRRRWAAGEGARSVVVRRSRPGSDRASVVVTVAYRVEETDDE